MGRTLVEVTSSDPISETTPVVSGTAQDADTVLDSEYIAFVLNSIDTLLSQPRKRDGTEMFETGIVPGTPPRNEVTTNAMAVDEDPDATLVCEPMGQKQKADDVTKELVDDAAKKAAKEKKQEMADDNDRREERLFTRMEGSKRNAVDEAVCRLATDLKSSMQRWESQMDDKVQSQVQGHWVNFEKKWENKIVQLEPGSKGW